MSKRYRLSLMGISLIILIAVGTYFTKSLSFIVNDFWFASGLLLLILLSLVDQPFFSKDCNIFVNAVTAALSLLLIPADQRTLVYWIFLSIVTYLIVSSYVLMWLRKYELNLEHPIVQILTRINRQLGRPEAIFSSFFLWGAIRQYKLDSTEFNALKTTAINILKGFFACSLVGIVPVELYKFCVALQNTFAGDLTGIFAGEQTGSFGAFVVDTLALAFNPTNVTTDALMTVCILIAFAYCVIKVFFANIKRGGILLIQIAVGELYMFSVPRGYTDGFNQWCKQIAALCLTAFMQTTLLFLGMMTFPGNMLLGLGIMLAANEVPRIAQQFGLDSSVRVNMSSIVHTTSTAVSIGRAVAKAK